MANPNIQPLSEAQILAWREFDYALANGQNPYIHSKTNVDAYDRRRAEERRSQPVISVPVRNQKSNPIPALSRSQLEAFEQYDAELRTPVDWKVIEQPDLKDGWYWLTGSVAVMDP